MNMYQRLRALFITHHEMIDVIPLALLFLPLAE